MDSNSVVAYLSTLLNRPLDAQTALRLSSAQRARFNAWLHTRGGLRNDALLAGEFTIAQFVGAAGAAEPNVGTDPVAAATVPSTSGGAAFRLGVDIQSVDELMAGVNRTDFKSDVELLRLFTLRELSYAQARPDPAQTLAGVFAAKEAIRKCIGGAAMDEAAFRALEVLPDEHGRPEAAGYEISVSHSQGFAVAVACRAAAPLLERDAASAPVTSDADRTTSAPARAGLAMRVALLGTTLVLISLHIVLLTRLVG